MSPDPPAASAAPSPLRVAGVAPIDPALHDGGLRPAVGTENIQVMRASRLPPGGGGSPGIGWTYNHAPMLTWHRGTFFLHYLSDPVSEHVPPGCTLLVSSPDGRRWTPPRLLFPPYPDDRTPGGAGVVMHQRMGFYTSPDDGGRLLALGFYGENDGKGIGRVVREVHGPERFGPVYFLRLNRHAGWEESGVAFPPYSASPDAGFRSACERLLADRLVRAQWWEEDRAPDGYFTVEGYKALSFFRRPDGVVVGVWKGGSAAVTADEGKTWSPVVASPDVVTNGAKVWGQRTPDGRFALLYNPTADNNHRWPLAVVTGRDGATFRDMLAVHGELPPRRFFGRYKDLGPQYVRGIEPTGERGRGVGRNTPPGNDLWVAYSVNKEDVWISRVPTPVRYRVEKIVRDRFHRFTPGGPVPDWNLYGTLLAPVGISVVPGSGGGGAPCLALADADPHDYARAVRVFPESRRVDVRLRLRAEQADFGRLEVEVTDHRGRRPVRLHLTEAGRMELPEPGGSGPRPLTRYRAAEWHDLRLTVDVPSGVFDVTLDGRPVAERVPLAEGVATVERLSLRTGAYRETPDRATPIDALPDVDSPDGPVRPARFYLASVEITPGR